MRGVIGNMKQDFLYAVCEALASACFVPDFFIQLSRIQYINGIFEIHLIQLVTIRQRMKVPDANSLRAIDPRIPDLVRIEHMTKKRKASFGQPVLVIFKFICQQLIEVPLIFEHIFIKRFHTVFVSVTAFPI
jgi:hypothetical protein